jgi:dienelactone hydrolase
VFTGYQPHTTPSVELGHTTVHDSFTETKFRFQGLGGDMVPARMALPADAAQCPFVVVLYGMGQTMKIFETAAQPVTSKGMALIVFEQYGWGERSQPGLGNLTRLDVQERARHTYLESRILLDALAAWPELDSQQSFLWGFSFGGMCAAWAAADDLRYRACILTVCGGDFEMALPDPGHRLPRQAFEWGALSLLGPLINPIDPAPAISRVSPRPLLFQSALHDQIMPRSAAVALQDAALEPKYVIWYDTGHSRRQNDYEARVFEDGAAWLSSVGQSALE